MLLEIGSRFIFDCRHGGLYIRLGNRDWWWGD
jgi:hypothetical protein